MDWGRTRHTALLIFFSFGLHFEAGAQETLEIDRIVPIFETSGTSLAPAPETPGSIFAAIDEANELSQRSDVDYVSMVVEQSLINLSIVLEDELPAIDLDTSENPDIRTDLEGVPAFILTTAEDVPENFVLLRVKQGRADLVDLDLRSGRVNEDGDPVALNVEVENGARLGFRYAEDYSFDQNITGAGSVVIEAEKTLTLSGTNSYTGGSQLEKGTVRGNSQSLQGDWALGEDTQFEFEVTDATTVSTFSGTLTGQGSLVKVGAGELNLSGGVATHTGGTEIEDGTLLATTQSLTGNVAVNAGAEFEITQTIASTFGGDISGSGRVTKSGASELTLAGINSFSGGLTVEEGNLRGNSNSIPGDVTLETANPNVRLIFNQDTAGTHNGTIQGSGVLEKDGNGRLLLLGSTTVNQTQITNGTLAGTSESLGSNINILANANAEFTSNSEDTFSGNLAGAGNVLKTGSGTLTLTSNASHTGQTTIENGTLRLEANLLNTSLTRIESMGRIENRSGRVGGNLIVETGGQVNTGDIGNSLEVDGTATLNQGSILEISINDSGNSSPLIVNGQAILNSPLYELNILEGNYSVETPATLLNANDLQIGLGLGSVIEDLAFLKVTGPNPVGQRVEITLQENFSDIEAWAETPNQIATADALEQVTNSGTADARRIRDALAPLKIDQVPLVLDMMAGETLAAFTNLRINNARLFGNMISRRLAATNWELERPPARAPIDVRRPGDPMPPAARGGPGAWIEPFGLFGNDQGGGNATSIDSQSYGLSGGFDYRLPEDLSSRWHAERWRFGVAVGYTRQTLKNGIGYMNGEGNTLQTGLYGGYRAPRFHVGVAGRFAWSALQTDRRIAFSSLSRQAKANFNGLEWGGLVDVGGHFGQHRVARIHPFARFQYIRTTQDALQENGADELSLSAPSLSVDSLLLTLGARVSRVFTLQGQFGIEPEMRLAWTADYGDTDRPITTTFYNSPGALPFTTTGAPANGNAASVGLGYVMRLGDIPLLSTHYDALIGGNQIVHMISAGVLLRW